MLKRVNLSLLLVGLGYLGSVGLLGGLGALANDDGGCEGKTTDGAFSGVADPSGPYDLRLIDEMVMHHRGAIKSAEMMIADSERPELRDLAQRIQESQQRQIDQMLAWRAQWYPATAPPSMTMEPMAEMMESMSDGHGMMGGGMMGGMMNGTMNGMMGSMMGGEAADRMFLQMMIPHHQLAIDMAQDALRQAEHAELNGLAREIIAEQSAEITEMEGYLSAWYGEGSTQEQADHMFDMMRSMSGGC